MSKSAKRRLALIAYFAIGATAVFSLTQPWHTAVLDASQSVEIRGTQLGVLLVAGAVGGIVGVLVCALRLVPRFVTGCIGMLFAALGVYAALTVNADGALHAAVARLTGLDGPETLSVVTEQTATVWPGVYFATAIALALLSAVVATPLARGIDDRVTRTAASAPSKYQRDTELAWDSLDRGDDPTAR